MKKILLICCLLFGMPASAETLERNAILCGDLHADLFHSALGGAPYEHLLDVVGYYSEFLREGAEEPILSIMMHHIYIELGKDKMKYGLSNLKVAKFESGNKACANYNLRIYWRE